ncbi:hypothetical protein V6N13_094102 [Hibiscus sabdariffa]|uniref:Uncharacterized protein n=1 Tax=Hibiscus sabdariffa TaxID=183260 RepID=A0ABR2BKD6_9ROSI
MDVSPTVALDQADISRNRTIPAHTQRKMVCNEAYLESNPDRKNKAALQSSDKVNVIQLVEGQEVVVVASESHHLGKHVVVSIIEKQTQKLGSVGGKVIKPRDSAGRALNGNRSGLQLHKDVELGCRHIRHHQIR